LCIFFVKYRKFRKWNPSPLFLLCSIFNAPKLIDIPANPQSLFLSIKPKLTSPSRKDSSRIK